MMKKVVIVAPTFNEQENIESFLTSVLKEQKNLPDYDLCILISDSHSKDNTAAIVKRFARENKKIHYLDVVDRGLGLGLIKGLDYAVNVMKADILVTMEADLSNSPAELPDFLKKIKTADIVVGSRYVAGGKIVNWSWWRKYLSLGANLVLRLLAFAPQIHEFTNLYRAFKSDVWRNIRPQVKMHVDWIFVPAFIFHALGENFKIVEQPIVYFDRFGGRSKMRTVSYTLNLLRYAVRFRLQKSVRVFKFAIIGAAGFVINTVALIVGVHFGLLPSIAGPLGAELAILSNFFWNNIWTFSDRKLTSWSQIPWKFVQFNILSFGSVIIQFVFLRGGEIIFGLEKYKTAIINLPIIRFISWYMVFYVIGVGVGLIWNYIMYSRIIWKKTNETSPK